MSTISCTIGGTPVTIKNNSVNLSSQHSQRSILSLTVEDSTGTLFFLRGQQIVFSDSVLGIEYTGWVQTALPQRLAVNLSQTYQEIIVTTMDNQYLPDKRTNELPYVNFKAGDIVADFIETTLASEGVTGDYALEHDSTITEFGTGLLTNAASIQTPNGNTGDGQLQIAKAGADLTITENTTAVFAAGTLSNVTATANTLVPNTVSGLKMVATLPFTQPNANLRVNIWSGSKALGTNDTFNFTIFISSASPEIKVSVGLLFNDGTNTTAIADANGFPIDGTTDLATQAKDKWDTRAFSTTTYNGKTISKVYVEFGGTTSGIYTCYIQNVFLTSASGTPFFSTTATAPNVNPPTVQVTTGYPTTCVLSSVSPVVNPNVSNRISTNYSIDSVKLLMSSTISWVVVGTSGKATISASYDGGATYQPCTNGSALPAFPVGSVLASLTLTLLESFDVGSDPTIVPALQSVIVSLVSAPNASKSDVVKSFSTQANWNTGTKTGVVAASNGDLTTGGINSGWAQGQLLNETFIASSGTSKSVKAGVYTNVIPVDSTNDKILATRMDYAGTLTAPFSIDFDCTIPTTYNYASTVVVYYLQTYWGDTSADHAAYNFLIGSIPTTGNNLVMWRGTNSNSGSATQIATVGAQLPGHVRITVNALHVHNIYFDNNTVPVMTFTDSTYTSGQVAIAAYEFHQNPGSGGTGTFTFSNVVISPAPTQTWLSAATSVSSLTTYGDSVISWTEANTTVSDGKDAAIFVQSTIDGGTTYQTCINGQPIPNFTAAQSLSGISVQILVSFYTEASQVGLPIMRQLSWRVLGAYPGATGTRSTFPLGIDTFNRANASGTWGTSSDSQTYTKGGTGTVNIASNTGTITTTTGNVTMRLGSGTGTDLEDTVDLKLSAGSDIAGTMLRYVDSTHYYKLVTTGTTISLVKNVGSGDSTLASASVSLSTGTFYTVRYRVKDSGTVHLYGKIWQTGTTEPGTIVYGEVNESNPQWTLTATDTGTTNASGGYGLVGNSASGTVTFDNLRITQFPDPSLNLSTVGRIDSTGVNWTAITPGSSSVAVVTSTDGFTTNSATSGGSITGPFPQSDPVIDTFNTNTSANYTNTNRTGGSVATVTYTTTSSRLALSGGTNGIYTYNAIVRANVDLSVTMDQSDAGGLVWCFNDASNFYYLQIGDSLSSVAANTLTLAKVVANSRTQLATSSISFPTLTRVIALRVTMGDGIINVYYESATPLFTVTDNALGAGKMGLYNTTGSSRYYQARFMALGDDMTGKWLYHKSTLTTPSANINPAVTDQLFSMRGPLLADGATIPALHSEKNPFKSYYSVEMNKLTQLSSNAASDYLWDVDQNRKMIFTNRQTMIAPRCINTVDLLYTAMVKPTFSAQLYRNRQNITNCTGTNTVTGEQKITDGTATSWQLQYPVYAVSAITVAGVTKTFGQQGIDSGKDFYWQANSVSISQDPSAPRIATGIIISIDYMGQFVTTVTRDNTTEQAARAAIETNTSGIVEAWEDGLGMLVAQATTYADGLLARYANNGTVEVVVQTRDGSYAQGMLTSFFLPESNVFDQNLTITKIVTRPTQRGDGNVDYTYEITATNGPNLNRWASVLGY